MVQKSHHPTAEKKRGAIDVDGVIGNYTQLYLAAVRAATKREIPKDWAPAQWDIDEELGLTKAEKRASYALMNQPGVADQMAHYPGTVEGIKQLSKVADLFFVTSPIDSSPTWCYDRKRWLKKLFGEELSDTVTYTGHKYAFAADFLVDDKPANCEEWAAAWPKGKALLWTANYSPAFFHDRLTHVKSWEEVCNWVSLLPPSLYKPVDRED
jgi:5'(3')-deoxyribonucleotidase